MCHWASMTLGLSELLETPGLTRLARRSYPMTRHQASKRQIVHELAKSSWRTGPGNMTWTRLDHKQMAQIISVTFSCLGRWLWSKEVSFTKRWHCHRRNLRCEISCTYPSTNSLGRTLRTSYRGHPRTWHGSKSVWLMPIVHARSSFLAAALASLLRGALCRELRCMRIVMACPGTNHRIQVFQASV